MTKIFIDLEMNTVSKKSTDPNIRISREIIEIGAVKLDEQDRIIDTFKTYVKPVLNDKIAAKITKMTGITTDMVIDRPLLQESMNAFTAWCGPDCEIYAWSESDLRQIQKEYQVKNIPASEQLNTLQDHWHDFQQILGDMCHIQCQLSLEDAVRIVGMDFSGKAHDALTDATNTAKIYIHSKTADFTNVQSILDEAFTEHSFSMGDMFNFKLVQLAG